MNVQQIIQHFISELTKLDHDKSYDELLALTRDNTKLDPDGFYGFVLKGKFRSPYSLSGIEKVLKKPIHKDLTQRALDWLNHIEDLDKDVRVMQQQLGVLLRACESLQDIRDALPDIARKSLPAIANLPRLKKEAWPLLEKPFQLHQNKYLKEKIMFYNANRMLY